MRRSFHAAVLALAVLVPVAGVAQSSPSAGSWVELRVPESGFSLSFPSQPSHKIQEIPTQIGVLTSPTWMLEFDNGRAAFMIQYADYPQAHIDSVGVGEMIRKVVEGGRATLPGPPPILTDITLDIAGHPGRQVSFETDQLMLKTRVFQVKTRAYIMAAVRTKGGAVDEAAADRFLRSFALISER